MLVAQQQKAATAAVTARLNKQHSERDTSTTTTTSTSSAVMKGSWGEVKLDSGKLLPALPPNNAGQVLLPAGALLLLRRMLGWPGMLPLLRWVAGGHFLVGLRDGSLGSLLADVQAPHVRFLLLEAADILGLHPLPQVHVLQAAAPFVHMLHVPTTRLPAADSSSLGPQQHQQQQQGEVYSRQRQVLLVLSSAALQLLQPGELQAAMAGALTPALLARAASCDADDAGSCAAAPSAAAAAGWVSDRPGEPSFADLATLSALLALQPAFLLSHLPPEMHAMGGSLAAALQAAQRLVAVAGDRGSLLVAQDLATAVGAVAATSKGCGSAGSSAGGASAGAGTSDAKGALAQQWLQRVLEGGAHGLQQLLPHHACLASAAADSLDGSAAGTRGVRSLKLGHGSRHDSRHESSSSSSSGGGGGALELDDEQVLLMRVQQLAEWAGSQQYAELMAAPRPLRRVVQRGRAPSA
uniref:Uncharacterized protein n=1 Tax=Tetradesmus obliquus TaxID=3088 RepID=A0A383WE67_TETOB|eukprot:jgi/Sobl393_1/898/SZX75560.1